MQLLLLLLLLFVVCCLLLLAVVAVAVAVIAGKLVVESERVSASLQLVHCVAARKLRQAKIGRWTAGQLDSETST